ncbi:unnamed protein product, partial [Mesorhabditis spiculigera]
MAAGRDAQNSTDEEETPRGRGRPRKYPIQEASSSASSASSVSDERQEFRIISPNKRLTKRRSRAKPSTSSDEEEENCRDSARRRRAGVRLRHQVEADRAGPSTSANWPRHSPRRFNERSAGNRSSEGLSDEGVDPEEFRRKLRTRPFIPGDDFEEDEDEEQEEDEDDDEQFEPSRPRRTARKRRRDSEDEEEDEDEEDEGVRKSSARRPARKRRGSSGDDDEEDDDENEHVRPARPKRTSRRPRRDSEDEEEDEEDEEEAEDVQPSRPKRTSRRRRRYSEDEEEEEEEESEEDEQVRSSKSRRTARKRRNGSEDDSEDFKGPGRKRWADEEPQAGRRTSARISRDSEKEDSDQEESEDEHEPRRSCRRRIGILERMDLSGTRRKTREDTEDSEVRTTRRFLRRRMIEEDEVRRSGSEVSTSRRRSRRSQKLEDRSDDETLIRRSRARRDESSLADSDGPKRRRRKREEDESSPEPREEFIPKEEDVDIVKESYCRVAVDYDKLRKTEGLAAWCKSQSEAAEAKAQEQDKRLETPFDISKLKCTAPDKLAGDYKKDNVDDSAPVIALDTWSPFLGLKRLAYWSYTERNIKADEEHGLSHLPLLDEKATGDWSDDLIDDFEDGIHGIREGWSHHLNDWMLYRMLRELVPSFEAQDRQLDLYKTIYHLFPNKLPVSKLIWHIRDYGPRYCFDPKNVQLPSTSKFEQKTPSRPIRPPQLTLSPLSPKARANKASDNFVHSLKVLYCPRCLTFDCQTHGNSEEEIWKRSADTLRNESKASGDTNLEPCDNQCYRLKPTSSFEPLRPQVNETYLVEHFKKMATERKGAHQSCRLAKLAKFYFKKEVACVQMFDLLKNNGVPEFIDDKEEKEEAERRRQFNRDHHHIFRNKRFKMGERRLGGQTVSTSHRMVPCRHAGPCEEGRCPCLRDNNLCSKYCQCLDCPHKFPGCRCVGKCNTRQCACYMANYECDPDLCDNCGGHSDLDNCIAEQAGECGELPPELSEIIWAGESEERRKRKSERCGKGPSTCQNNQIQKGLQKKLKIGTSDIEGYGCFLDEDCLKGELISEYCGEIITADECERRGRVYDILGCSYIFNLNNEQGVDATRIGNLVRFANHCDEANCAPKILIVNGSHRIGLYAKRDLKKGSELFFNYAYEKVHKIRTLKTLRNKDVVVDSDDEVKRRVEELKNAHADMTPSRQSSHS